MANRASVHQTPTSVSRDALTKLHRLSKFVFHPLANQPAVLSETELATIKGLRDEKDVVKFITPYFERMFLDLGLVVVNSENFPWLVEDMGEKKKPDLYLIPEWAYTKCTADSKGNLLDVNRRFGTVEDSRLYDLVRIFDCKKTVGDHARGECIIHMRCLTSKQMGNKTITNGAIFSTEFLELLEVDGYVVTRQEIVSWSSAGSTSCIRNSIQYRASPWYSAPQLLRQHTSESFVIADPHKIPALNCSFLGAGSLGRVMRLATIDSTGQQQLTNHAMKVTLESGEKELARERLRLKQHAEVCDCNCMVRPCSDLLLTESLCGYIMTPVGHSQVSQAQLKREKLALFVKVGNALHRLHAHTPPIIHGDPRIHNIINSIPTADEEEHGGLFWIDLAKSPGVLSTDVRDLSNELKFEVGILVESMCKGVSVGDEVTRAIERYGDNPSREAMTAVMVLVASEFVKVHGI